MTAPAFAETSANYNTNQTVEQEVDLSAVFADNQNLQVATLSTQEMQETEGAWAANAVGAVAGAGIATWGYMGNAATTGDFSWGKLAVVAGVGAATGAISPVGTIGKYYAVSRLSGVGGAVTGIVK